MTSKSPLLHLVTGLSLLQVTFAVDNGLGRTPQMGWNSWNEFDCNIDQDLIKEVIAAMVSTGLRDVGYEYVNLDDCWQESRDPSTGEIQANPTTFPDGIPPLAQLAHDNDLKFGLYSDAGNYTCQHKPGSLGYETIDANTYAKWEVDYLKYDNCYDDGIPPETRFPPMAAALNATGRDIFFSLCEWGVDYPFNWAPALGNSWRTTPDIHDNWESMLANWDMNGPAWAAGPGAWNDPDMLEVGNGGMTDTEYRTHFTLWALGKAPLLVGCDVRNMSPATAAILMNKEVIAVNQDPLGVQCTLRDFVDQNVQVYGGPLVDGAYAVGILNRASSSVTSVTLDFNALDLDHSKSYVLRDLWAHQDLGTFSGSYTTGTIASHETLALKLTPVA